MMMNHLACVCQAQRNIIDGPVAVLWDIEHCPVPCCVQPGNVAGNVRKALHMHPVVKGAVTLFSAYGDFNTFSRRFREGCQRTGVKLVDVPGGRKCGSDKAILVDMFIFALDNRPPASILLISGDIDLSPALHILGQRGYNIIVVVPAIADAESALSSAGMFVWDWPTVARGDGFVPQSTVPHECEPAGCRITHQLGDQKIRWNEKVYVRREIPESEYSVPTERDQVFHHKCTHIPMEFEKAHLFSKCRTPQDLRSNPAEGSKFGQKRLEEQSLQVQSLDIGKKHAAKLKMKQKVCSAPAKVKPIFNYTYDPISKEFNGTRFAAENNGSHRAVSNPNSSKVPVVDQNTLGEHALPMKSLDTDKKLGKRKHEEFETLAKIDPTFHCRHSPIPKKFNVIPHLLSENNHQRSLPSEPSEVLVVENGLSQVKLQAQSLDADTSTKRKRKRKKTMKQNEHDEPASPVFPFRYRQIPVEFNGTHNALDCNSLPSLPPNPNEVSLVQQNVVKGHNLQEHSDNIDEDQFKEEDVDESK